MLNNTAIIDDPYAMAFLLGVYVPIFVAGLIIDISLLRRIRYNPPDWTAAEDRIRSYPWLGRDGLCVVLVWMSCYLASLLIKRFMAESVTRIPAGSLIPSPKMI